MPAKGGSGARSCKRFQESCFPAGSAVKAGAYALRRAVVAPRHNFANIGGGRAEKLLGALLCFAAGSGIVFLQPVSETGRKISVYPGKTGQRGIQ